MKELKKQIEDLEHRVKELERIVRELIAHKKDKEEIVVDKDGFQAIGYRIHDYKLNH